MAHSTGAYNIRQLVESDWNAVSTVYRAMLTDTPTAFGETIQEIEQRTDSDWKSLVAQWAEGSRAVAFIAEDAAGYCGFVRADTTDPRTPPGTVLVSNLWTAPRQRGRGLGRVLMNAVEQWARRHQAERIALGVTEENHSAFGFYSARPTGGTEVRVRGGEGATGPSWGDSVTLAREKAASFAYLPDFFSTCNFIVARQPRERLGNGVLRARLSYTLRPAAFTFDPAPIPWQRAHR